MRTSSPGPGTAASTPRPGRILDEPGGRAVLSFVGGAGQPAGLDDDRRGVARPFYVLAQSFVRYLADHAGLDAVVGAAADADPPGALARLTGRSTEAWKGDWLAAIRTTRGAPRPSVPSQDYARPHCAQLTRARKRGGRRALVACSKAYAIRMSFPSVQARPMNVIPTGRSNTNPAGTLIAG